MQTWLCWWPWTQNHSEGVLCIYTFVPTSWMCEKQTSVSHSSTEAEINFSRCSFTRGCGETCSATNHGEKHTNTHIRSQIQHMFLSDSMSIVSFETWNLLFLAPCFPLLDNEAVIKMIIKGRSPTMRHVSRTHRVALDGLFDRINLGPEIQIKYVDTKNQLADMLTKGSSARDESNKSSPFVQYQHF